MEDTALLQKPMVSHSTGQRDRGHVGDRGRWWWWGVSLLPLKVGLTLDRGGGHLPGLCGLGAGLGLPQRVYAEASKALGCPEKAGVDGGKQTKGIFE